MAPLIWNKTAAEMARLAQENLGSSGRGIVLLPFPTEDLLVVWVFGCDQGPPQAVSQGMDLARARLNGLSMEELGSGLGKDGHSWAWAGQTDLGGWQTGAGQGFRVEMMAVALAEAVQADWQAIRFDAQGQDGWLIHRDQPSVGT
jgi:hypothetical protein